MLHWIAKDPEIGIGVEAVNDMLSGYDGYDENDTNTPSIYKGEHCKVRQIQPLFCELTFHTCLQTSRPDPQKSKLKQTASQILTIAKHFVSIFEGVIYDHGKASDPKWMSVCMLIQFTFLCMMPEFDGIHVLQGAVQHSCSSVLTLAWVS